MAGRSTLRTVSPFLSLHARSLFSSKFVILTLLVRCCRGLLVYPIAVPGSQAVRRCGFVRRPSYIYCGVFLSSTLDVSQSTNKRPHCSSATRFRFWGSR